jgi:hypothetical protein
MRALGKYGGEIQIGGVVLGSGRSLVLVRICIDLAQFGSKPPHATMPLS